MKIRVTMSVPRTWSEAVKAFCAAAGAGGGMHPEELAKIAEEIGDDGDGLYEAVLKAWAAACVRSGDDPPGPNPIAYKWVAGGHRLCWGTACGNTITLTQNGGAPEALLFAYDSASTLLVDRLGAAEAAGAHSAYVYEDDGYTVAFNPWEKLPARKILTDFLAGVVAE